MCNREADEITDDAKARQQQKQQQNVQRGGYGVDLCVCRLLAESLQHPVYKRIAIKNEDQRRKQPQIVPCKLAGIECLPKPRRKQKLAGCRYERKRDTEGYAFSNDRPNPRAVILRVHPAERGYKHVGKRGNQCAWEHQNGEDHAVERAVARHCIIVRFGRLTQTARYEKMLRGG